MPQKFIESFVARLRQIYSFAVKISDHREKLVQGTVYFAPGGRTNLMLADPEAPKFIRRPRSDANDVCPSIDVLLESAAALGDRAVGVVLSGMGCDGAKGLLSMRNAGASTIAQDQATSVVYGMPRAAYENGGARHVAPLHKIGGALLDICTKAEIGVEAV